MECGFNVEMGELKLRINTKASTTLDIDGNEKKRTFQVMRRHSFI